ncbi:MAG: DUF4301 family protein [Deltaproteobacteria bacterium]|nr:DUF4301 family protein [Deltaproteobacteria bacterium]
MNEHLFNDDDIQQMNAHGIFVKEAERQVALFKTARPYLKLAGPCVPGNGIAVFDREKQKSLTALFEKENHKRSIIKFVPASGAASRMFKVLSAYLNQPGEIEQERVSRDAQAGQASAKQLLTFMEGLTRFAFFQELSSILTKKGLSIETLLKKGFFRDIIRLLLTEEGLGYAALPKGLLLFHRYPERARTPFEEHLVEAVSYASDAKSRCLLHFTVSPEHLDRFKACLNRVEPTYETLLYATFQVNFSKQKASTDTLAVDLENRPFRLANGRLLFRPGGHGALLENLNDLQADIVFIKNIDNVVPDYLKYETYRWKKIAGGYLISIQKRIAHYMKNLASESTDPGLLEEVTAFLKNDLLVAMPQAVETAQPDTKKRWIMDRLNRPVRVCGMVKNTGEPGGGPFWVESKSGDKSRQIVETAQVDPDDEAQQTMLAGSTHFNPVDLVCGVRNWQGEPFDLRKFVDPDTVFISLKSKNGKELKALEHPGLWNGSMAQWITLFVEVPAITFNPVKTVNDLLRKEHQPADGPSTP